MLQDLINGYCLKKISATRGVILLIFYSFSNISHVLFLYSSSDTLAAGGQFDHNL